MYSMYEMPVRWIRVDMTGDEWITRNCGTKWRQAGWISQ